MQSPFVPPGLIGALIGIYAARRARKKTSWKDLSAMEIIGGAVLGAWLLALLPLVGQLRGGANTGEAMGEWIGTGLGVALMVGLPAAWLATRSRPRVP